MEAPNSGEYPAQCSTVMDHMNNMVHNNELNHTNNMPTCNERATDTAGFLDQIGYKLYWLITLLTYIRLEPFQNQFIELVFSYKMHLEPTSGDNCEQSYGPMKFVTKNDSQNPAVSV